MKIADEYVVYLGARDWRHAEWVGAFYPEDMPEDWRLTFFGTQFSCVWLDAEQWRAVSPEDANGWQTDMPAGFRLLLEHVAGMSELPPIWKAEHCRSLAADDARLVWFDRETDLRALTERIDRARQDPPIYLISRDHDLGKVEQVRTLLGLLDL